MQRKRCNNRINRISQEIHKEVSIILHNRINDPRIGVPTISAVCISKDLKNAKIFVTFLDKETFSEIYIATMVLQRAAKCIRFWLAKSIYLRTVPILLFKYDSSLVQSIRICDLITRKATIMHY